MTIVLHLQPYIACGLLSVGGGSVSSRRFSKPSLSGNRGKKSRYVRAVPDSSRKGQHPSMVTWRSRCREEKGKISLIEYIRAPCYRALESDLSSASDVLTARGLIFAGCMSALPFTERRVWCLLLNVSTMDIYRWVHHAIAADKWAPVDFSPRLLVEARRYSLSLLSGV